MLPNTIYPPRRFSLLFENTGVLPELQVPSIVGDVKNAGDKYQQICFTGDELFF